MSDERSNTPTDCDGKPPMTSDEIYKLCYLVRDMSAELRSIGVFYKNAYTLDFNLEGKDLVGTGITLTRIAKKLESISRSLDVLGTERL